MTTKVAVVLPRDSFLSGHVYFVCTTYVTAAISYATGVQLDIERNISDFICKDK
jgi:hypothetical protein